MQFKRISERKEQKKQNNQKFNHKFHRKFHSVKYKTQFVDYNSTIKYILLHLSFGLFIYIQRNSFMFCHALGHGEKREEIEKPDLVVK